jgi:hypothetical protein
MNRTRRTLRRCATKETADPSFSSGRCHNPAIERSIMGDKK